MIKQMFVVISVFCASAGIACAQTSLHEQRDSYAQKCDAYGLEAMKLQENFAQYKIWSMMMATDKQTICREGLQIIDELLKQREAPVAAAAPAPVPVSVPIPIAVTPAPVVVAESKLDVVQASFKIEGHVPLPRPRPKRKVKVIRPLNQVWLPQRASVTHIPMQ
jgi:hypothetical protein